MTYETVWTFDTANYRVSCKFSPCQDDPADLFQFQEDIDDVREDRVLWFDALVTVEHNGHVIGSDSLCGCAYLTVDDFIAAHRNANPMDRNSSIMRAVKGQNAAICHYFPSMVHEAIRDARRTLQS